MRRVLVTGASGFIGATVLPVLVGAGWDVIGLSTREDHSQRCPGVTWMQADVLRPDEMEALCVRIKATHLLHLAWYTKHGAFWHAEDNFGWVTATLHLLDCFRRNGGVRAVIAGTCAEYDWEFGFCREGVTPLNPSTPYGVSKDALRRLATAYCELHGVELAWARLFHLYGPGEDGKRFVSSIVRALIAGEKAGCTHGHHQRDFLYARDVAHALRILLEDDHGGSFNVASGTAVPLYSVAHLIAEKLGALDLLADSPDIVSASDTSLLVGDNQKLRALGWHPATMLAEGIEETIDWWRMQIARGAGL